MAEAIEKEKREAASTPEAGRRKRDADGSTVRAKAKGGSGDVTGRKSDDRRQSPSKVSSNAARKRREVISRAEAGDEKSSTDRRKAGKGTRAATGEAVERKPENPAAGAAVERSGSVASGGVAKREKAGQSDGSASREAHKITKSGSKRPRKADAPAKARRAAGSRGSDARDESAAKGGDVPQSGDLFLENREAKPRKRAGKTPPPERGGALFGALNVCLMIGIAVLIALGARQHAAYADFLEMRSVVDQQTFYAGTTVEGVDVSHMTLSDAMTHWSERVEPRYANRTVALDNGVTVTSAQLGYASDYASVLSAAWSAGRNGSLEERYRMASGRRESPVAYSVTRSDYDDEALDRFVRSMAAQTDKPVKEADIVSFDAERYEFQFSEAENGKRLDTEALKRDVAQAVGAGGGSVSLLVETIAPELSTTEVAARYGLIAYAITNANSSSKARLNNIKLAMSTINGTRVGPGEVFSFNEVVGQRTTARGYRKATAYSGGDVTEQVGGGICQVSTTLFNAAVKADMEIVERHNHSLTVSYVDRGKDATVDWGGQDFKFKNNSDDDVYICCYLTEDKRVRFGIFGKLLPNGETITLDAVTTETEKYETQYIETPLLDRGQTYLLEQGKNGYKAEAYKVRWDGQGNEISRELLCRSVYKSKPEIIQYGT